MYVTGSVGVISTKSLKIYRVSWNAIHMPSIPPAALPSREASENPSAPSKPGKTPPATEPIIIPIIIMDFRDIFVAVKVTCLGIDMISFRLKVKGRRDPIQIYVRSTPCFSALAAASRPGKDYQK